MVSHILIGKCEYCGRQNCIAHAKYTDRCVECGRRYAKYSSYKSLQRSQPTAKLARLIENLVVEYIDLRNAGHKVPRDLRLTDKK